MDVASTAVAKMLLSSDMFRGEAQANWSPGIHGGLFLALNPRRPSGGLGITDPFGGGGGARSFGDGVDTGGIPHSMASRIANVEVAESRAPQLDQSSGASCVDSGGPGRFRGGVARSPALRPQGSAGAQHPDAASGVAVPAGRGLSGGLPGIACTAVIVAASTICGPPSPRAHPGRRGGAPGAAEIELQEAKQVTSLGPTMSSSGSRAAAPDYGDPLAGSPVRSCATCATGSSRCARARGLRRRSLGGDGSLDARGRRRARRPARLPALEGAGRRRDGPIGEGRSRRQSTPSRRWPRGGEDALRCTVCRRRLGDLRRGSQAGVRGQLELPLSATVPGNAAFRQDYVLRAYSCPGCGTQLALTSLEPDEPSRTSPASAPIPRGAD